MTRAYRAYFVERVRPALFVPVLVALWLTALWASGTGSLIGRSNAPNFRSPAGVALSAFLLLTLLVLQFRLWDDLEDRERDRRCHPDRVLVRSNVTPFRWMLALLTVGAMSVAATANLITLLGVVLLDALFLVAYRVIRPQVSELVWRFPILLAKYPAFVALTASALSGVSARRLGVAMLVAMAGACAYEAIHHERQPAGVAS